MGCRPFFYSGAGSREAVKAAIKLGKYFGCGPMVFVDEDDETIMNLWDETVIVIREEKLA